LLIAEGAVVVINDKTVPNPRLDAMRMLFGVQTGLMRFLGITAGSRGLLKNDQKNRDAAERSARTVIERAAAETDLI